MKNEQPLKNLARDFIKILLGKSFLKKRLKRFTALKFEVIHFVYKFNFLIQEAITL